MLCTTIIVLDKNGKTYARTKNVQPTLVNFDVQVDGRISHCRLTQQYDINSTDDIHSTKYKFPLDFNSALYSLTVQTPRETIQGVIQEKIQAQQTFEQGKKEGKQVFLTRQDENDPDICVLEIGNILKNDKLIVTLEYVSEVSYNGNKGVFFIPTFISPRFNGEYIPAAQSNINARIVVNSISGIIQTQTPGITTEFDAVNKRMTFTYTSTGQIEKDIEIMFTVDMSVSAFKFASKSRTFAVVNYLPQVQLQQTKKEIVFVLDCSGSMEGDRIKNSSKAILHIMKLMQSDTNDNKNEYKFTVIRYGSECVPVSHRLISSSNKEKMDEMINLCANLNADLGGTETYNALQKALTFGKRCLLITDGDTSDNTNLHELCKQFETLNILGIGDGINRANIVELARCGNGMALFNQGGTDTTSNIEVLFKACLVPIIFGAKTNLDEVPSLPTVSLLTAMFVPKYVPKNVTTHYPIIPNSFNVTYALIDPSSNVDKYVVNAKNEQCEINLEIPFTAPSSSINLDRLACLIAKRLIQQNSNLDKEFAVKLACEFNVMTEHTSLVAVSDHVTNIKPKDDLNLVIEKMYESYSVNSLACFSTAAGLSASRNGSLKRSMAFTKQSITNNLSLDDDALDYEDDGDDDDKMDVVENPLSFDELIREHFDGQTGLCKESIRTLFTIPATFNTPKLLTMYVLLILKTMYTESEYKTFMDMIADNYSITDYNQFATLNVKELKKYINSKTTTDKKVCLTN